MKDETLLVHSGRDPEANFGIVNPPVYRASTILYPTLAAFKARHERKYTGFSYGLHGTPTTFALAEAVQALEGGHRTLVTSSGLSMITTTLAAFLKAGDHILVADTVYGPTRAFCDGVLKRFDVETTYYDPLLGAGIAELMRANTRIVFTESPGSLTFEVQDIPAIAQAAHAGGALVVLDNTWATPLCFKSFEHGVDVSLHAATKYIAGHSDLVLGLITARGELTFRAIKDSVGAFGDCPAPDVCFQALRGLRSLAVSLRHHERAGLEIARWLQKRPEVKRVLHPALSEDPGHALWKRDFRGASGLFGVVLHATAEDAVAAMLDPMELFKMGASWGGYESLIIPAWPAANRSVTEWKEPGFVLRISIGLEAVEDLIADLKAGLERLSATLKATG